MFLVSFGYEDLRRASAIWMDNTGVWISAIITEHEELRGKFNPSAF